MNNKKKKISFSLEIFDMNSEEPKPIGLEIECRTVQACNFNLRGELILYCIVDEYVNEVRVYSIRAQAKCKKNYKLRGKAEVINISKYDRVWLRFNDHIHELDLSNGDSTTISANIKKVFCHHYNVEFT